MRFAAPHGADGPSAEHAQASKRMRARVRWFVTATALLTFGAVPSSSAAVGVSVLPPAVGDAVSQFRRTFAPAEVPGLGADVRSLTAARLGSSDRPLSADGRAINVVTSDGRRQVVASVFGPIATADGQIPSFVPRPTAAGWAVEESPVPAAMPAGYGAFAFATPAGRLVLEPTDSSTSAGALVESAVRYPSVRPGVDAVLRAGTMGLESHLLLASGLAPHGFTFRVRAPAGTSVSTDGRIVRVADASGESLGFLSDLITTDAAGQVGAASYALVGDLLTVTVPRVGDSGRPWSYPIDVDPVYVSPNNQIFGYQCNSFFEAWTNGFTGQYNPAQGRPCNGADPTYSTDGQVGRVRETYGQVFWGYSFGGWKYTWDKPLLAQTGQRVVQGDWTGYARIVQAGAAPYSYWRFVPRNLDGSYRGKSYDTLGRYDAGWQNGHVDPSYGPETIDAPVWSWELVSYNGAHYGQDSLLEVHTATHRIEDNTPPAIFDGPTVRGGYPAGPGVAYTSGAPVDVTWKVDWKTGYNPQGATYANVAGPGISGTSQFAFIYNDLNDSNDSYTTLSGRFDPAGRPEGVYTVRVGAGDGLNAAAERTVQIVVDRTPPTPVAVGASPQTDCAAPSNVPYTDWTLASSDATSGLYGFTRTVDRSASTQSPGPQGGVDPTTAFRVTWTEPGYGDGVWYLHARAHDRAGNSSATTSRCVWIDRTPPTVPAITIADQPDPNAWSSEPAPAASWTATDNDQVAGYTTTVDTDPAGVPTAAPTSATSATLTLPDGTNYLHVVAVDRAGNRSPVATRMLRVDTTPPSGVGTARLISPAPNAAWTANRRFTLGWDTTPTDATSGIAAVCAVGADGDTGDPLEDAVDVTADGATIDDRICTDVGAPVAGGSQLTVDTNQQETGALRFSVVAVDLAGNETALENVAFTEPYWFDDQAPVLQDVSGELSDRRDGTAIPFSTTPGPSVHVDVTDAGAGLDAVRFYVDDQQKASATGPCAGCALEADFALPANLLPGQHQIRIRATDLQGAVTEQAWTITVGPPVLPLAAPTRAQIAADGTAPTAEIVATGAQWDRLRALLRVTDDLRLSKVEVFSQTPSGASTVDTITCDSTDCTDRPDHTIHYQRTLPQGGALGAYQVTVCAYDVANTKTCTEPSEQQVAIIKAAPTATARLRLVEIDRPGGDFPQDNRPDGNGGMVDANIANRSVTKAASLGANGVIAEARWYEIAPTTKPTNAINPDDRAYKTPAQDDGKPNWRPLDLLTQQTSLRGMTAQLNIWGTPTWASDRDLEAERRGIKRYALQPRANDEDLLRFAYAIQQRYSGWYPASVDGSSGMHLLPRVSRYVAWNEPNSPVFLWPQYSPIGSTARFLPSAPGTFARLAKQIVSGLDRSASVADLSQDEKPVVGAAGLQVFGKGEEQVGDTKPRAMRPRTFIRGLRGRLLAGIDAWSYHPYPLHDPGNDVVSEKDFGCASPGKSRDQLATCRFTNRGLDYFDVFNYAPAPAPAQIDSRIARESIVEAATRRSSLREMRRLLNEQTGSGLANKPFWATETGIPIRYTTVYPLEASDGDESVRWLGDLVAKLEGNPSFSSELGFYYLQDSSGTEMDFTTGLRDFTDGRGNGTPRHTGCALAKLWGGSGYLEGGEWRSSYLDDCR